MAGGKEAEIEYEINLLHKLVEDEILHKNLLGKFTPLIVGISHRVLLEDNIQKNYYLYKSAILSLCKFMCISQKFCEQNLPFIFKILNSDTIEPCIKLNICAAFGDFINRFPNTLQKQVKVKYSLDKFMETQMANKNKTKQKSFLKSKKTNYEKKNAQNIN